MKILQVPFCFYPDPVGGTEVYVEALATQLQRLGHNSPIAAPHSSNCSYIRHELSIHRFALSPNHSDLRTLYGEGDSIAAQNFEQILDRERPDLVHLHAFTAGVSVRLVHAAHRRQIPVVFTYHTPTVSCQRGTLLRDGQEICDGQLNQSTCTRCTLHGLGLDTRQADLLACLPPQLGQSLGYLGLQGGPWTAIRMSELIQCRHNAFQDLVTEVEHIIAVCDWVKAVLLRNQVVEEKITVLRQGLCSSAAVSNSSQEIVSSSNRTDLRLVFLGRLDPTKGVHLLIQAFAKLEKELNISLDIYGISQASDRDSYYDELMTLARADPRINFKSPIPVNQVISTLANYDLLAVPSQCLETGPLVALEAFAAGIPVLGSRLGGIAELVQDGVNGLLVEPASVDAWATMIQRLSDRSQLESLKTGISFPSDMHFVSSQMMSIYSQVIGDKSD